MPHLERTCTMHPPALRARPTDATSRHPGHVLFQVHMEQPRDHCSYGRTSERSLNAPMVSATPATIAKPAISPMIAASVTGGASSANTDATTLRTPNAAVQPQCT